MDGEVSATYGPNRRTDKVKYRVALVKIYITCVIHYNLKLSTFLIQSLSELHVWRGQCNMWTNRRTDKVKYRVALVKIYIMCVIHHNLKLSTQNKNSDSIIIRTTWMGRSSLH